MGRLILVLFRSAVDRAVWLANHGPRFIPLPLRMVPLRFLAFLVRLRHDLGGMGVMTPMKAQNSPSKPSSRVDCPAPAQVLAARPEKRSSNINE